MAFQESGYEHCLTKDALREMSFPLWELLARYLNSHCLVHRVIKIKVLTDPSLVFIRNPVLPSTSSASPSLGNS